VRISSHGREIIFLRTQKNFAQEASSYGEGICNPFHYPSRSMKRTILHEGIKNPFSIP